MELGLLTAVFILGIISSFISVIAGSEDLIAISALIFTGLPPQIAIATNKLGDYGLVIGRAIKFWKSKYIRWDYVIPFVTVSSLASFLGANMLVYITYVNKEILYQIIGVLLLIAAGLMLYSKNLGLKENQKVGKKRKGVGYILKFLNSVYEGFLGAGSEITARLINMFFFKLSHLEIMATNSVTKIVTALVSLTILGIAGYINYLYGFILFLGMIIGSYAGANMAIKKGNVWIRYLSAAVAVVLAIRLLLF